MSGLYDFLADVKQHGQAAGQFLGLLNILIGRRVEKDDGTLISSGVTWRELSFALKKVRWEKEAVHDLGIDPADLPPRDRQRYWYSAIAKARVDSPEATAAGDRLAEALRRIGYTISSGPADASEKRR